MSSPQPEGRVAGVPTKWLLIGGGGILVAFLFLNRSSGGGRQEEGGDARYLGPNAALAVGDLQNQLLRQSGIIQDYTENRIDSLQSALDAQGKALGDQLHGIGDQLGNADYYSKQLRQSVLGLYFPMMSDQSGSLEDRKRWWDWLSKVFKAQNLGELPAFDPTQDYWGTKGAYPLTQQEAVGTSDFMG